jgi:hypothetical protein
MKRNLIFFIEVCDVHLKEMKNFKYFVLLIIVVRSGVFTEPLISPLQNQTYMLNSGSYGLKIVPFSQSFVFSGYCTQIIEVYFLSILSTNFTLLAISLRCEFDLYSYLRDICFRYNSMIWAAHEPSNSCNLLLHKKYEAILKQQRVHSWLSRQKIFASILPIVGDALSFLFGTLTSRDITEINENYSQLTLIVGDSIQETATLKKQLLSVARITQSNTEKINEVLSEVTEHINYLETHESVQKAL